MRTTRGVGMMSLVWLLSACQPDAEMLLSDGQSLSRESLSAGALVINYWAEWCAPCREEIPELNTLSQEAGVRVLGVDFDGHPPEELAEVTRRMGIGFPQIMGSLDAFWSLPTPTGLPQTVLIQAGEVHAILRGPQSRDSILAALSEPAQPPFSTGE